MVTDPTWFTGPSFLWNNDEIPRESVESELSDEDPEVKRVRSLATNVVAPHFESERLRGFSDWFKAKRAVANCAKLKFKLLNKGGSSEITVNDLNVAEKEILRSVQREAFVFTDKILTDLKDLDPFYDQDGILRVGGRIKRAKVPVEFRHPAILPRNYHITELIIRYYHEKTQHSGRGITTTEIRSHGYWIVGCSAAVSSYIRNCVTCKKLRAKTCVQKMADLPDDRVEPSPPFTYCAVDYFGPWQVKVGRKSAKRWGAVFVH